MARRRPLQVSIPTLNNSVFDGDIAATAPDSGLSSNFSITYDNTAADPYVNKHFYANDAFVKLPDPIARKIALASYDKPKHLTEEIGRRIGPIIYIIVVIVLIIVAGVTGHPAAIVLSVFGVVGAFLLILKVTHTTILKSLNPKIVDSGGSISRTMRDLGSVTGLGLHTRKPPDFWVRAKDFEEYQANPDDVNFQLMVDRTEWSKIPADIRYDMAGGVYTNLPPETRPQTWSSEQAAKLLKMIGKNPEEYDMTRREWTKKEFDNLTKFAVFTPLDDAPVKRSTPKNITPNKKQKIKPLTLTIQAKAPPLTNIETSPSTSQSPTLYFGVWAPDHPYDK